jgi:hypothetical protein
MFASTQEFANSKDVFADMQRHWNRQIIVRPNPVIVRFAACGVWRKSSGNRQMFSRNRQITPCPITLNSLRKPMVSAPTNARSV